MTQTVGFIVVTWRRGLVAAAALAILSACAAKPDPTPAESAAVCPQLKKESADEQAQFNARSPLHKQIATEFADKASQKAVKGERALFVQHDKSKQYMADGVMAECLPYHGEAKCKPVALEYADYNERNYNRLMKQFRYQCLSRGHDL